MSVMSVMGQLATLSNIGRERGFTHYEYGVDLLSGLHSITGVTEDGKRMNLLRLNSESRAKAVVNLLNSDAGWEDGHQEGIGEMGP